MTHKSGKGDGEVSETLRALEMLAYLGCEADSVRDRRELDELLRSTETVVDAQEDDVEEELPAVSLLAS
jgi:hypothetical protein